MHILYCYLLRNITQSGDEQCRVHQTSEDCPTCCAWHTDGSKFYVAGTRGQFFECVSLNFLSVQNINCVLVL